MLAELERELLTSNRYCRDTIFTSLLHPNRRCYREIPQRVGDECIPGRQFCFGKNGLFEKSPDLYSPVYGKDLDGYCLLDLECSGEHLKVDMFGNDSFIKIIKEYSVIAIVIATVYQVINKNV